MQRENKNECGSAIEVKSEFPQGILYPRTRVKCHFQNNLDLSAFLREIPVCFWFKYRKQRCTACSLRLLSASKTKVFQLWVICTCVQNPSNTSYGFLDPEVWHKACWWKCLTGFYLQMSMNVPLGELRVPDSGSVSTLLEAIFANVIKVLIWCTSEANINATVMKSMYHETFHRRELAYTIVAPRPTALGQNCVLWD